MHPMRRLGGFGRQWRTMRNRERVRLLSRRNEELAVVPEAWFTEVSRNDQQYVISVQRQSKSWHLPVGLLPTGRKPETHQVIEDSAGKLWEIMNAHTAAAENVWTCVCVEMPVNE